MSCLSSASLLAITLASTDQLDQAEEMAREVLDASDAAGDGSSYPSWLARFALGLCQEERGDLAAAEVSYRAAWEGLTRVWGEGHPFTFPPLTASVTLLMDQERFAEAEPLARRLAADCRRTYPEGHPYIGWTEGILAEAVAGQQAP